MEQSALVYIILTLITIALGAFVRNGAYVKSHVSGERLAEEPKGYCREQARNFVAEFGIFCLLTGVSACRIAVGNDYWVYRDQFKLIAQGRHVSYELGFRKIVEWMQLLFGYDNYLPIFALFSFLTVLFFVKALHDQASNYAFALFLLLTGGFYFNSLNSVRYYFALAMALYSMKYVLRGDYLKFVLWIVTAALFHKSVLLVIPVYLLARFLASHKIHKWYYVAGAVFTLSLLFCQNLYREIIFYFYPFYRDSQFDNGDISYTNIAKCLGTMILCCICYRNSLKDNLMNRFYFFLNVAAFVVYCCGSFIPEVSRVGYYLIVSQIFLLPRLLEDMKRGPLRRLCYVGVIAAFSAYFIFLLRGMYDINVRLLPYLNWIFD